MGQPWAPEIWPAALDEKALNRLLPCLVGLDEDWLEANPRTPPLQDFMFNRRVLYRADPVGREKWLVIPWVIQRRAADCKSLAAWRVAELRCRGEKADAVYYRDPSDPQVFHVVVRRGDGRIEDPSKAAGMGWSEGVSR